MEEKELKMPSFMVLESDDSVEFRNALASVYSHSLDELIYKYTKKYGYISANLAKKFSREVSIVDPLINAVQQLDLEFAKKYSTELLKFVKNDSTVHTKLKSTVKFLADISDYWYEFLDTTLARADSGFETYREFLGRTKNKHNGFSLFWKFGRDSNILALEKKMNELNKKLKKNIVKNRREQLKRVYYSAGLVGLLSFWKRKMVKNSKNRFSKLSLGFQSKWDNLVMAKGNELNDYVNILSQNVKSIKEKLKIRLNNSVKFYKQEKENLALNVANAKALIDERIKGLRKNLVTKKEDEATNKAKIASVKQYLIVKVAQYKKVLNLKAGLKIVTTVNNESKKESKLSFVGTMKEKITNKFTDFKSFATSKKDKFNNAVHQNSDNLKRGAFIGSSILLAALGSYFVGSKNINEPNIDTIANIDDSIDYDNDLSGVITSGIISNVSDVEIPEVKNEEIETLDEEEQISLADENIEFTDNTAFVVDEDARIYQTKDDVASDVNGVKPSYVDVEKEVYKLVFERDGETKTVLASNYDKCINLKKDGWSVVGIGAINENSRTANGDVVMEGYYRTEDVQILTRAR